MGVYLVERGGCVGKNARDELNAMRVPGFELLLADAPCGKLKVLSERRCINADETAVLRDMPVIKVLGFAREGIMDSDAGG